MTSPRLVKEDHPFKFSSHSVDSQHSVGPLARLAPLLHELHNRYVMSIFSKNASSGLTGRLKLSSQNNATQRRLPSHVTYDQRTINVQSSRIQSSTKSPYSTRRTPPRSRCSKSTSMVFNSVTRALPTTWSYRGCGASDGRN